MKNVDAAKLLLFFYAAHPLLVKERVVGAPLDIPQPQNRKLIAALLHIIYIYRRVGVQIQTV